MHWHQLRSQISQVFLVTSHVVGIFALHLVSLIQLLSLYLFSQFLTCTRIPCRDSECENGLVRCCLYTSVGCSRPPSAVNDPTATKEKVKVARLRFIPKRQTTGLRWSHLWTFFEMLWAPPGIAPLPPTGGRTRWLVPVLILPEWHWPKLSFSRFLV